MNAEQARLYATITSREPSANFTADDGIRHTLWHVSDPKEVAKITSIFAGFDSIYIADGHHRSAAGARTAQHYREKFPNYTGNEEFNYFLTVIFPENEMKILPYNRIVKDICGMSDREFLEKIRGSFNVSEIAGKKAAEPDKPYRIGMYMNGKWYRLEAKQSVIEKSDPVKSLDVYVLAKNVLEPLLKIENPRTDPRIDFVGGIRGLAALEKHVNSGAWKLAFAMHPTSVSQLLAVADAGLVMPPKSTWFEPKLRSGMVVHMLDV